MTRPFQAALVASAVICCALALPAQSLGERARELRAQKSGTSKRVITNDDLAKSAPLADEPSEGAAQGEAATASAEGKTGAAPAAPAPAATPADRSQLETEFRGKADEAKRNIAQIERELDVLQRENKLRAAVFYADAGTRLRDEAKFAAEDRRYQAEIQAKQTELTQARQGYDELKEQARRAGVSSRSTD